MPIDVDLFTLDIGGRQYAFDTGDISYGDAETKEVPKNLGTSIINLSFRKRNVTFTIRGANGTDLENLYQTVDDNKLALVNATAPVTGEDLQIGADTIYDALLLDVQAGPPLNVGGNSIIEQVQVRYDSQVWV
jgi:hypothetical protein